jgi:hypothetical protein
MTKLSVVDIAGQYCGSHLEGEKLYESIALSLSGGDMVELDFDQVELTSSSFFNELFGRISENFGEQSIDSRLSFVSLKPRHRFVLERTRHSAPA